MTIFTNINKSRSDVSVQVNLPPLIAALTEFLLRGKFMHLFYTNGCTASCSNIDGFMECVCVHVCALACVHMRVHA